MGNKVKKGCWDVGKWVGVVRAGANAVGQCNFKLICINNAIRLCIASIEVNLQSEISRMCAQGLRSIGRGIFSCSQKTKLKGCYEPTREYKTL